jgi:hypothetical protein
MSRRIPPEMAKPAYQTLPRAKTSAFSTPRPTRQWPERVPADERKAWQREQASAFLVPHDVLDALERLCKKAGDPQVRADRCDVLTW